MDLRFRFLNAAPFGGRAAGVAQRHDARRMIGQDDRVEIRKGFSLIGAEAADLGLHLAEALPVRLLKQERGDLHCLLAPPAQFVDEQLHVVAGVVQIVDAGFDVVEFLVR